MNRELEKTLSRRRFLKSVAAIGGSVAFLGGGSAYASRGPGGKRKKTLVLGMDGMDPNLLRKYMDEGLMPNFKRFLATGSFSTLQTSAPPQSPVAWSNFITGMDSGGHGIFDFIHRDPETMDPYLSMSKATAGTRKLEFGSWVFPLEGGEVKQLRKGRAWWQILDDHGVPTVVFRIPANFPPVEFSGKSLSGMGTPDILGSPGTFSYFTDLVPDNAHEISGGEVFEVAVEDCRVDAELKGPKNEFRRIAKGEAVEGEEVEYETPELKIGFTVYLDPEDKAAKFVVGDNEFILNQGEWSDWIPLEFKAVPGLVSVSAAGRFYLKEVRPHFKLYVTPLQISPENPAMPISTPESWAKELHKNLGHFFTQGLPEDSKALSGGVLSGREFWQQAQFVYKERRRALEYLLENFDEGVLFFYFSSLDQGCHMLWRYADEKHPAYDPTQDLGDAIRTLYGEMDDSLGYALDHIDEDTTIIAMSDHGFAPFYRAVNLNSWLAKRRYARLRNPGKQGRYKYFGNVQWDRTKAYGLGINGLYVNLKGREKNGIVEPGMEYDELLDELEADLLAMRDEKNGAPPISQIVKCRQDFHGDLADSGPDIIVGYHPGYRCSWASPLGEFPKEIIVDNNEAWSADHCIDSRAVPGILVTNRKITMENPSLCDLTVAVLAEYDVDPPSDMIGRNCLG